MARGTFYGVVAVLLAVSLVASSFAFMYYDQYWRQVSEAQRYAGELDTALAQYRQLSSSYQTALNEYNRTISLLSQALSALNTSTPAYREGSLALTSLWKTYLNLTQVRGGPLPYSVDMLLEYGNGTKLWFNQTAVQPGWNAYIVTLVSVNGDLQATWYPNYDEHFVNGIQGLENNPSENRAWSLWTWNSSNVWQVANVGPDEIPTYNGSVFAWAYCTYDPNTFAPLCTP